jgi:3-oxoacyl-[acyl-carrier protein] reductase
MSRRAEEAVVIVTDGSRSIGREVVRRLAGHGYAIVVVYLDNQSAAEATVDEVLAVGGTAVAVRADLTDELDVERLFTETIAAFGGVDVVVHFTAGGASLLYEHASHHLRRGSAIVSVSSAEQIAPELTQRLRERDVTINGVPPGAAPPRVDRDAADVLAVLNRWKHRPGG